MTRAAPHSEPAAPPVDPHLEDLERQLKALQDSTVTIKRRIKERKKALGL